MNRRGRRFLTVRQFISHASSLKVKSLGLQELEFYEQHCLLLPVVRIHMPASYVVALTQRGCGVRISSPDELDTPDDWLRLNAGCEDGMHPFDRELDNPLLVIPDRANFRPWDADKVSVTITNGRTVARPTVERYYASWQVHVIALLRRHRYYERSQFLRELPESHNLRKLYRLPEDTEEFRTLRGMASGYDALTLYGVAAEVAIQEAIASVPADQVLPDAEHNALQELLAQRAQRALRMSGVDEPAFFGFVSKLTGMIQDYRIDERVALAEDTEQDLWDASTFAHYGFDHDWDGFLAAAEHEVGAHLATTLRRLDPVEVAAHEAQQNLASILQDGIAASTCADSSDLANLPMEIVDFCLKHDLYEVLVGLQSYSYTASEERRDGYPGFLHRRLRPLALAIEYLARGILDAAQEAHHGKRLSELIAIIGRNSSWLKQFNSLVSTGETSDKTGTLDQRAWMLAQSIQRLDTRDDELVARTLVVAVASRNLVTHRHEFLSREVTLTLGGACSYAAVLVWLLAKAEGYV